MPKTPLSPEAKATKAVEKYIREMDEEMESENYHSLIGVHLIGVHDRIYKALQKNGVDAVTTLKILKDIGSLM